MNKKVVSIIAIGVVILLAIAGYLVFGQNNDQNSNQNTSETTDQKNTEQSSQTENNAQFTNAQALAKAGKPVHCTFDYDGDKGTATGDIYTDGQGNSRMTVDDIQTDQNNTGTSNMIITQAKYYSWFTINGETTGFEGDLTSLSSSDSSTTSGSNNSPAPNSDYSMQCTDWSVDRSKFTVPTDVNFINFNDFKIPATN